MSLDFDVAACSPYPSGPFTPGMVRVMGVAKPDLLRAVRHGVVVPLLRGVYVLADIPLDALDRAAAVRLVAPRDSIAVDRTAAWIHGWTGVPDPHGDGRVPLELVAANHRASRRLRRRQLYHGDIEVLAKMPVSTPLRTALDLGRNLLPERALAAMDTMAATGAFTMDELLSRVPTMAGCSGVGQLRWLAPRVDSRAATCAESVLRLHWCEAELPTPALDWWVKKRRLAFALPMHRFGVVIDAESSTMKWWAQSGWKVIDVPSRRLLAGDPSLVTDFIVAEFRTHLVGLWESSA